MSLLRVLLTAVSHVEIRHYGKNREGNDGSDNTYRIWRIRHSFSSKLKFRGAPPTIAPTFVPLLVITSEAAVGSGPPVELLVPLGSEIVPPLLVKVLIGFGFTSGSPDQNL